MNNEEREERRERRKRRKLARKEYRNSLSVQTSKSGFNSGVWFLEAYLNNKKRDEEEAAATKAAEAENKASS